MSTARTRMTAEDRRAAILETAARSFSKGSYRGTTTAEIAREAGITEPVLYRHFDSKRDLYLTCLDEAWDGVCAIWVRAVDDEPDPKAWLPAMARAYSELRDQKVQLANLWIQAITEATDDPEIRKALRRHMQRVHRFVADVVVRSQEAGGIRPDRDPTAEAWIFISLGLLMTVGRRLGGLLEDDLPEIIASRRRWLTDAE